MRVLFVNENIGGHATVHANLAWALRDHPEVEAEFLHIPSPGLLRRVAGARVPVLSPLDLDLQPLRLQLAQSAWVRRELWRRRHHHYDALHVYTHNAGLLSVAWMRRLPTVVSLDTTTANNAYRLPYRPAGRFVRVTVSASRPFERRVFSAAELLVANTSWAAESLLTYGVAGERIRRFPFGVRVPEQDRPVPRADVPPSIVFVGRQLERKGALGLVELHQRHLRDRARLVLVTDEDFRPPPGVEVVGGVRPGDGRVEQILAAATVFVFPSTIDQAPNAVLEAMAVGVPVVALRVGGVPEMVTDGVTGRLVDPGDDRALLAAITAYLDDPSTAFEAGRAARRDVQARYDVRGSTVRLLEVLGEAVSARRGTGSVVATTVTSSQNMRSMGKISK